MYAYRRLVLFAFLLSAAASLHVRAAEPARLAEKVNYDDLNPDTERGARVLLARLRLAARNVCEPLAGFGVSMRSRWSACYEQALSAAVADVNRPRVTALFISPESDPPG